MSIHAWPSCTSDLGSAPVPDDLWSEPSAVLLPSDGDGLIIWVEHRQGGPVLHLEGALDLAGGAHLGTTVQQVRASDRGHLTVDATALRFIDLSGHRALLACQGLRAGATDKPELLMGAAVQRLRHLVELAGGGSTAAPAPDAYRRSGSDAEQVAVPPA